MPDVEILAPPVDALRMAGSLLGLARALEQRLRATGEGDALTLAELGVLGQIARGVEQPGQIARAQRLDPARVTHLTDRLVASGYVVRQLNATDRRRWQLALTEAGATRLAAGREAVRLAMEALLAGLDEEELTGLMAGLEGARRVLADLP